MKLVIDSELRDAVYRIVSASKCDQIPFGNVIQVMQAFMNLPSLPEPKVEVKAEKATKQKK